MPPSPSTDATVILSAQVHRQPINERVSEFLTTELLSDASFSEQAAECLNQILCEIFRTLFAEEVDSGRSHYLALIFLIKSIPDSKEEGR